MSEIEKLYQNAGFNKREIENCTYKNSTPCGHSCDDGEDCPYLEIKEDYPQFTAEKQIAILQFCLKWGQVHILKGIDDNEYRIENSCYRYGYQPTLADAIANYINEKWEKLPSEERQQIKEILK